MRFVELKNEHNLYLPEGYNDESMLLLANFLRSDVATSANIFVEFIEDPRIRYASGNACDIRWKDGTNVTLTYQLFECDKGYDDPDFIPELRFQTTIPEFIKLLRQWDAAIRTIPQPQELIITQDNSGKVNLDIKN